MTTDHPRIERDVVQEFRDGFRGETIRPSDDDYDEARTIFNAMIDKHPRLIATCSDVADVIAAVNFGREHGLETAIRSGGHSGPGHSLVEDGLVIDLSEMTGAGRMTGTHSRLKLATAST